MKKVFNNYPPKQRAFHVVVLRLTGVMILLFFMLSNLACFPFRTSIIDESGHFVKRNIEGYTYGPFYDGFAEIYVHSRDKWGYIDPKGTLLSGLIYDKVCEFNEGLAAVRMNGKWGFIDTKGNFVIEPRFIGHYYRGEESAPGVDRAFYEGLCAVYIKGKWGFMDTQGNIVINPKFEFTWGFSDGLAKVRQNGLHGYIDKSGNWVIRPRYRFAKNFKYGVIPVSFFGVLKKETSEQRQMYVTGAANSTWVINNDIDKGQWGLIDRDDRIVLPPTYDYIDDFREGLAIVSRDKKYGYIDPKGNLVIPLIYEYAWDFSEGLAFVKKNGRFGVINMKGKVVIPFRFETFGKFSDGLAVVRRKKNGKWGYINKKGDVVIPFKFDRASSFSRGYALVEE